MSRWLLLVALLLMGVGCQALRDKVGDGPCEPRRGGRKGPLGECGPGSCGPGPSPCPPAPCPPAAPVCQPPPPKVEAPAPKPPVGAPAPAQSELRTEVHEKQAQQQQGVGAVAQDILLVPRTVYVPYSAQVPVAPARLAGLAAPGPAPTLSERHEITTQRTTASDTRQAVSAAREGDANLNLELLKALRALNDKLEQQQQRLSAPAPAPVAAPLPAPVCAPVPPACHPVPDPGCAAPPPGVPLAVNGVPMNAMPNNAPGMPLPPPGMSSPPPGVPLPLYGAPPPPGPANNAVSNPLPPGPANPPLGPG